RIFMFCSAKVTWFMQYASETIECLQSNMQERILMLEENETISLPRLYFGGWLKQSLSSTTTLVKPDTVRLQVYGGGMFTQRGTWDGTMALEL
ncbi:hypothetical protein, partial [uncultured Prevotella sp.]|uniref:hypothetical protein n=1 Tax=uncultured Prevotella sp. TaxID=159272 RepID=UPI00263964FA